MIHDKGLSMTLLPQWDTLGLPKGLQEATNKYRGQPQLDSANNKVIGFTAGIPFPDIDVNDPDAAKKIVWNNYLAGPIGYTSSSDVSFFALQHGSRLRAQK
jgi:hypothetical protein